MKSQRGTTLIEVLIAVSLLGLLSTGILFALRVSLISLDKGGARLMDNRRVAGTQYILQEQMANFIPARGICLTEPGNPNSAGMPIAYFQGEPAVMRFVSSYSLAGAARGYANLLEYLVIPGQDDGVRLVVNEIPYDGMRVLSTTCLGYGSDPLTNLLVPRFLPVMAGPRSFVLADRLQYCRFSYLFKPRPPLPPRWLAHWGGGWPTALRVEMAPFAADASRLRPVTVTAAIRPDRPLELPDGL